MSEPTCTSATATAPAPAPAATLPWSDPTCTEHSVADLTAADITAANDGFGPS